MADDGASTTYTIDYAKSNCTMCSSKACAGSKIDQGRLRVGTLVAKGPYDVTSWMHWHCVTDAALLDIGSEANLGGFDDLDDDDQEVVKKAFEASLAADKSTKKDATKAEKAATKKLQSKQGAGAAEVEPDADVAGDDDAMRD